MLVFFVEGANLLDQFLAIYSDLARMMKEMQVLHSEKAMLQNKVDEFEGDAF